MTGEIKIWSTDTAPEGWLLCDGDDVSQSTYAALYAVIGTTFGAPGGGDFTLPDMRGRIPLGKDNMGGSSANRVTDSEADTIGDGAGTENASDSHGHKMYYATGGGAGATNSHVKTQSEDHTMWTSARGDDNPVTWVAYPDGGGSGGWRAGNGDVTGGNVAPYLTLNYIIKT